MLRIQFRNDVDNYLLDLKAQYPFYLELHGFAGIMWWEVLMLYQPRKEGQGLVEYALILVLVAVVVIVILALLGPVIGNVFSGIVQGL